MRAGEGDGKGGTCSGRHLFKGGTCSDSDEGEEYKDGELEYGETELECRELGVAVSEDDGPRCECGACMYVIQFSVLLN